MEAAGNELVEAIRAGLRTVGDPERAAGQQKYMKSAMPFVGVSAAARRPLVRALVDDPALRCASRGEWLSVVHALWEEAGYREERYAALDVLRHRACRGWRDPDLMPVVEDLIVSGAWWDLVDDLSNVVGEVLLKDPKGEGLRMRQWAEHEDLWLRRSAIISQLRHRERTDTDLLEAVIEVNLADRDFFVRKAIGWALRQYARTDPDWVRDIVERYGDRMSGLSRREALKHL